MHFDRRAVLKAAAAAPGAMLMAAPAGPARAAPSLDAAQFGVRAGSNDDQSRALQRAIDQAASRHTPLALGPGVYKGAGLKLPAGAQITGVRGATRLILSQAASLFSADHADGVVLSGLVLDGNTIAPPDNRGLVQISASRGIKITDCEILRAGRHGIVLEGVEGQVVATTIIAAADTALFSRDGRGVLIAGNTIRGAGNGGIRVWQTEKRDDGTIIADNRIEDTAARAGGSGQNGNAINVYRATNVIVRGNRIRTAAFSAVRGNAASNIQITGNTCSGLGEVAIYAEFDFEGAAITGNIVDGAALGVVVTNFDKGGRLATVQGNVLRNIMARRPAGTDPGDGFGIGIGVEADTAVTGNVIENALTAGIDIGSGAYLRDVTVTGNVVRDAPYGITVSVAKGAGSAVIAHNMISGARAGAIVGMEWKKVVTGDLAKDGAGAYSQLTITGNQLR